MPISSHAALHQVGRSVGRFASNCTDNSNADCTSHCSQHSLHSTPNPLPETAGQATYRFTLHHSVLFPLDFTVHKIPPSFSVPYSYCRKFNSHIPSAHFYVTTDVSTVSLPPTRYMASVPTPLNFPNPSLNLNALSIVVHTISNFQQKTRHLLLKVYYIILPSLLWRLVSVSQRPVFTPPS